MNTRPQKLIIAAASLAVAATFALAPNARAASQTWTNAPVDSNWTNVLNWDGGAAAGADNMSGNTTIADVATFNAPIPLSGIGGTANPIHVDDATIAGDRSRQVSGIVFDSVNCGAYVISGTTPTVYPGTGILYVTHNGNISMTALVTNSESFLIPILTRLPSSTAGVFSFINNATNPSAILMISSVTNDSATSRGTTFILDGTNAGFNTLSNLSQGLGANGSSGLTKQGLGTWVLPGANLLGAKSPININAGLLIAQNAASLGQATGATVNSNGTLRVDGGVVLGQTTITLQLRGTLKINGSTTINAVTVGTPVGTVPTLATTSSGDVMTVGIAANAVTGGSSASTLHVSGPGTVMLGQSDNYLGSWSADAGTLQLVNPAGLGTGPNLNVGAGAVVDVTSFTTGGGTFNPSTASVSGSGTGTAVGSTAATIKADASGTVDLATGTKGITLTFAPTAFTGDTTHPALYVSQGTLKLGGNAFSIVNASGTPLGVGTYTLISQATGSITDGGSYSVVGVTGSGLVAGNVASISVSGGNVNLVVSPYVSKNLVWTGGPANANWDVNLDANWLNGSSASVFNNSDFATFNAVGSTNPIVTLIGTLAPSTVTVDTTANNYTFTGSGSIAGSASLTKNGTGTLLVQTVNSYSTGTTINNGVLQLGANNAIPSIGTGDVTMTSPAILDLNGFSDTINALSGSGTVDTVAGGTSELTIGNNNDTGVFTGVIKNTAGVLGITKNGNGTETLSGANTYTGNTTINGGTLVVANIGALGSGASAVTNNSVLNLQTSVIIGTLAGSGTIANNATATTNVLIVTNTSTYNGIIADGTGGGGLSVLVSSGTLRLNSANTYSGGTIIASGAGLAVGSGGSNPGTGGVLASNNATISQPNTGSSSSGPGNPITTVDGAAITLLSSTTANNYGGQFFGSATATNDFANGNMSIGGAMSFSNFLGTVVFSGGEVRWFNAASGGDQTTFLLVSNGGCFTRDADVVHLGALFGDASAIITSPSVTPGGSYWIGGKNIDSEYPGSFTGSNSLVKIGTGTLTLDGATAPVVSSPDGGLTFFTNLVYVTTDIALAGPVTVSNGVLKLVAPVTLTNVYNANPPPSIILASPTAVLDGNSMGFINTDGITFTNLVTNGVLEVVSSQVFSGLGTVRATNLIFDAGSTLNIGLPYGNLSATTGVTLNGLVTANVNVTNTPNNCGELLASSFTIGGSATLVITNLGPENAAKFQLFNHPVSFASVTLPTLVGATNSWQNNLAVDGSITLVAPPVVTVNQNPTNITFSVSGSTLSLSWPADHIGWRLLVQTNNLAHGISQNTNDWMTVPGSTTVDQTNITINPSLPDDFYRLVYP